MSTFKVLVILALATIVVAQEIEKEHRKREHEPDFSLHIQCRGCLLQGRKWCAKGEGSDYDGTCKLTSETCETGTSAVAKIEACPNDAPSSKHSCSSCVLDGYSWCQDKMRLRDEYAGRCVSYPNGPNPWQPHQASPPADRKPDADANENHETLGSTGAADHDSADWGMCADDTQLVFVPQECANAMMERQDGKWGPEEWHGKAGWMIAFGVLKFVLITALVCCCVKKCRRRCKERCAQWREKHCRGSASACHNGQNNNNSGAGVSVQDGCSYVGVPEDQQLAQALANSVQHNNMMNNSNSNNNSNPPALNPNLAPINVTVNLPGSSDRKDNTHGVQMHTVNPNNAYPSLKTNKDGYAQLQQIPDV